ncbi:unnamed protein product [Acanthoscelides obtectus]|uniref:Uncharacterized protein n=1 Tax=Acanthoscelides obtectus TaxID=200917 RepID=A0A9P0VUY4_ACAOB|nr:unnamed protein product [Acanthoscelides obtectus]CAK1685487.1 hypothetical protein AOBTE_LOCUS35449 [Acanthoscelides obtectus]
MVLHLPPTTTTRGLRLAKISAVSHYGLARKNIRRHDGLNQATEKGGGGRNVKLPSPDATTVGV